MTQHPEPGLSVAIRPVRSSDATGLVDFYARLTVESRRRRFLTGSIPDPDFIASLARDPGLVAVLNASVARHGAIAAHASVQPDGRHGAEIAFAVADELQGHGVGRRLVSRALHLARELGADRASATLLAGNIPMRHLLRAAGQPVKGDCIEAGTEEIDLDLRLAL